MDNVTELPEVVMEGGVSAPPAPVPETASFVETTAPEGTASMFSDSPPVLPGEETATSRTKRVDVAMAGTSPGPDQIKSDLLNGKEPEIRKLFAAQKDTELRELKIDIVKTFAAEKAKRGESIDDEDIRFVQELSREQVHNPDTIFETEYARQYFNNLVQLRKGNHVVSAALSENPEAATQEIEVASSIKARMEVVKTGLENLRDRWEKAGFWESAGTYGAMFVPFLENYRLHNVSTANTESIFPGENLEQQVQNMWGLPTQAFKKRFEETVSSLAEKNVFHALKFAEAVLNYGASDKHLDNAFALLDASDIATLGLGKAAVSLAKGARRGVAAVAGKASVEPLTAAKVALKDALKADASPAPKPVEKIIAESGDLETAGVVGAWKDARNTVAGQDPFGDRHRLINAVPSIFNPFKVLTGAKDLSAEASRRLTTALFSNAGNLLESLSKTNVTRLPEGSDALSVGLARAASDLKGMYPHLNDAVLDTAHVHSPVVNVHYAELQVGKNVDVASKLSDKPMTITTLGKTDATLFKSPTEASYWGSEIYKLNPDSYRIKENQQGLGFYLSIEKAVDETDDAVRDALINTKTQTPKGIFNTLFGRVRTPEDTVSELSRDNRHTITHGAQEIQRLAREVAQNISGLSNKSKDKLNRILKHNQDFEYYDPDSTKLRRGQYYKDVGEFDREWRAFHGVSPTDAERQAYFSAVQLNDWDYLLRNLGLYRDKARMGIERFRWFVPDGTGTLSRTDYIEGKRVNDLPWNEKDNFGVYMYDHESQKSVHFNKNVMTSEERARVTDKIQTGKYHVIQVANPLDKPLRKYVETEDSIHFVVVPDAERGTLDWKQLTYRAGGHTEYKHKWWTKQVRVRKTETGNVYEGDQTIFNFATEAEARKYADRMNEARILLKEGKHGDLEKYLERNLPYTLRDFKSLFEAKKAPDGSEIPPPLTLNEPIRHVQSGRNVLDDHADVGRGYENLQNDIRSPYNLYGQIDKKYAGERDPVAWTVRERQGIDEPLFRIEDAPFIDPLSTLQKGLANVVRSRYFNDYKIQSVETWIAEFADVLKNEGGLEAFRRDPIGTLHNAIFDNLHTDKAKLAAAKNSRQAVLNLLGTESQLSKNLRSMQEGVISSIYSGFGQSKSDWIANHLLPITKDPFHYMRSIAFHSKLGLFNPVQLFLQAQTLTHVAAVSGISNAIPGLFGATMMRRLSLTNNPKIIEHMADMATKMGWKKEDFIESYTALRKTGLYNVEGEVAMRDDVFDPKMFQGAMGSFLDKGTFFFREGERLVRLTAWNAAYREWKVKNPGKALTKNEDIQSILTRQNTLSVNMTRASNASWQQGLLSVPTQFWSYQARLMEQFLGKRLTPSEKAHAFTVYAAMYGVPTAVGATTAVWPWYEDVKAALFERGVQTNDIGVKAVMDGIPATMWQVITGNDQNWAQRYGPGGLSFFKDIFVKGKIEHIFGASPSILAGMIQSIDPIARGMVSVFRPDAEKFEFIAADFINAASNVSTLNNVGKAIFAYNTGLFVSKNEIKFDDKMTGMDALLSGIMGTTPTRVSDAFIKSFSLVEQKKAQDAIKKDVIKYFRRGIASGYEGNESGMAANMKNARILMIGGGFRPDEQATILREAMSGQESFVDKINRDFWQKAPTHQWKSRLEAHFGIKISDK
jgi:hypothetical protein